MKQENLYTPDCIRTFTGIYVNIIEPTLDMICIEDIAHSLSMQCRFGGHLHRFFSVAQHCCHCAANVKEKYKLQALLHDASEAYLLDMPSPIKRHLEDYKKIEARFMELIAKKFGFRYPVESHVKWIDANMLQLEWQWLVINDTSLIERSRRFECWDSFSAENEFLKQFYAL